MTPKERLDKAFKQFDGLNNPGRAEAEELIAAHVAVLADAQEAIRAIGHGLVVQEKSRAKMRAHKHVQEPR